jgi:hypothetical protein
MVQRGPALEIYWEEVNGSDDESEEQNHSGRNQINQNNQNQNNQNQKNGNENKNEEVEMKIYEDVGNRNRGVDENFREEKCKSHFFFFFFFCWTCVSVG